LDSDVLYQAIEIQATFDMSFQDPVLLASVRRHLVQTKPAESCFQNRNTKDFDPGWKS